MKTLIAVAVGMAAGALAAPAMAANCLEVTLTGVQGGPPGPRTLATSRCVPGGDTEALGVRS
jgi:hypothetical protein